MCSYTILGLRPIENLKARKELVIRCTKVFEPYEVRMKRQSNPQISSSGELALAAYEQTLLEQEDLTPASIRNYKSDVRHFMAWYEHHIDTETHVFTPQAITTPALTRYRTFLQIVQQQKPASINRSLISLKRYFGWATQQQIIHYDPSAPVKLVGQEDGAPRHLDDKEEQALVAAVTEDMTLWTPPNYAFKEPGAICNRRLKPSPGHEGGKGYAGQYHHFSRATSR